MQPDPQPTQPKESLLGRALHAATKDGTLAAAWRQGLGELGEALKAFPDSIQVRELGSIGAPTPGEISMQRSLYGFSHEQESLSSLIDQARAAGSQDKAPDQEQKRGQERDL
jgi:hypothetical protein